MIEFALSNGIKMPSVGLGTFLMQPDKAEQAVYDALKLGSAWWTPPTAT